MHTLKRQAVVPYTPEQMFELVNNIRDYPRFLPWCARSAVISENEEEVVASLVIRFKAIQKSFTTRNRLYPHERIEMSLVSGPLQRMEGVWQFQPVNSNACRVMLDLEFAFAGGLIDRLFQPVFQHIANNMVEAFCERAAAVYGHE